MLTYARSDLIVAQILEMCQRRHDRLEIAQHRRTPISSQRRFGTIRFIVLHGGVVFITVTGSRFFRHNRQVIKVDVQFVARLLFVRFGLMAMMVTMVTFAGPGTGSGESGVLLIFIGLIRRIVVVVARVTGILRAQVMHVFAMFMFSNILNL